MVSRHPGPATAGPRRTGVLVVLACTIMLALAACRGATPTSSNVHFDLSVTPSPPAAGMPAEVAVQLSDSSGAPINDATVKIHGDMSHAGMQPVEAAAVHDTDGRYIAREFPFTMAGDWILTVEATLPDGERAGHRFDLKGVTGDMHGDMPMDHSTTEGH